MLSLEILMFAQTICQVEITGEINYVIMRRKKGREGKGFRER